LTNRVGSARFLSIALLIIFIAAYTSSSQAQGLSGTETYDFKMSKGILEFSKGRYERAAELFQQALGAKPGDVDALDYLGQTLLRLKNYEGAEKEFRESLEHQPSSARALLGLGIAQAGLGKYQEALTALNAAEKSSADNPLIYYFKGLVSQQLSAYDQSQALFSRAMALSPKQRQLQAGVRYRLRRSYTKGADCGRGFRRNRSSGCCAKPVQLSVSELQAASAVGGGK
jgi:tetratricopeptide (TPR) repeat protein